MYFLPQFRDQGHASLRIRHDLVSLLPCIRQLSRSTSGSQKLGVLTKRYDNSLFVRSDKNKDNAYVALASTSS